MSKTSKSSVGIRAPLERIWAIISSADSLPHWQPDCNKASGRIGRGGTVYVQSKKNPHATIVWKIDIKMEKHEILWTRSTYFGLCQYRHLYSLTQGGNGKVNFVLKAQMSGLLAPLMNKNYLVEPKYLFKVAAALKLEAEAARPVGF